MQFYQGCANHHARRLMVIFINTFKLIKMQKSNIPEGKIEIFCTSIVRKGKRIYPKNGKFFRFLVDEKKRT